MKQKISSVWFAAEYAFATTYSIREPGTAATFAKACPIPGPGTVKLALIKMSIELYGKEFTKQKLFSVIQNTNVLIRPPLKLGISGQILHAFKNKPQNNGEKQVSLSNREHIQPFGNLTVYAKCEEKKRNLLEPLFQLIGYWGQGNSLAYCVALQSLEPIQEECATKLTNLTPMGLKGYQVSYLIDIDRNATWDDVISGIGIFLSLYVLPLVLIDQKTNGRILMHERLPSDIFASEIS